MLGHTNPHSRAARNCHTSPPGFQKTSFKQQLKHYKLKSFATGEQNYLIQGVVRRGKFETNTETGKRFLSNPIFNPPTYRATCMFNDLPKPSSCLGLIRCTVKHSANDDITLRHSELQYWASFL